MTVDLLSRRQREIALLVATGASNKETPALACGASVARELAISTKTVKNILTTVFDKTGTRGRTELAVQIVRGAEQTRIGSSASEATRQPVQ